MNDCYGGKEQTVVHNFTLLFILLIKFLRNTKSSLYISASIKTGYSSNYVDLIEKEITGTSYEPEEF